MRIKIDPLDKLFSEYIRRRAIKDAGGCEWCGKPKFDIQKENGTTLPAWKQLDCAHFIGRRKVSVRYDPDNAIGTCKLGCHNAMDNHPAEKIAFFKARLGERGFDMLNHRARIPYPKPDKQAIELYLMEKMKEV